MSPTVQTLLLGLVALLVFACAGQLWAQKAGRARLLPWFFPVWLAYCLWHLSVGLGHGYSLASELPFLLLNFGLPAALAWWMLKKSR